MKYINILDIHTDSGYRKIEKAENVQGYDMNDLCSLHRGVPVNHGHVVPGTRPVDHGHVSLVLCRGVPANHGHVVLGTRPVDHGPVNLVHSLDPVSKTHRPVIRSSYSAEIVGASHDVEDVYQQSSHSSR